MSGGGVLWVVGTPIGNLEDLSFRALETLRSCALIACEDTRVTRAILARHELHVSLLSCHRFNETARAGRILSILEEGRDVALVSDSGTPGISDPGAAIVQAARHAGFRVAPVPGPSAAGALWSVSGLSGPFTFIGFLPQRGGERRRALEALRAEPRALVLYESPHRILAALEDAAAILGERQAIVGREMTKLHEEVLSGSLREIRDRLAAGRVRGEFTLLIAPPLASAGGADLSGARAGDGPGLDPAARLDAAAAEVLSLIASGIDKSAALRRVAREQGVPRRELYARLTRDAMRRRREAKDEEE